MKRGEEKKRFCRKSENEVYSRFQGRRNVVEEKEEGRKKDTEEEGEGKGEDMEEQGRDEEEMGERVRKSEGRTKLVMSERQDEAGVVF